MYRGVGVKERIGSVITQLDWVIYIRITHYGLRITENKICVFYSLDYRVKRVRITEILKTKHPITFIRYEGVEGVGVKS